MISTHPFRSLLLLALAAAVVIGLRNAVADKGGSYDPDATVSA
jgi:hypothetical protein